MPITRFSRQLLTAATVVLALTGCATTNHLSTAPVAAYRDTIELNGKIAVNYQHNGEQQPVNGKFTWTQRPGRVDVSVFDPFGQTVAEISVTPELATLTQPKREPRTAKDIDTLTQQTLGWPLPVAGLRDWLQGYAVDAQGKRFAASPANSNVVTRDGWRLRFVDWQQGTTTPMPRVIKAERSTTANGELSINIAILPES
jgi:outer membrane lipoprotein LolB